jgi:hypothetical protein
VPVHNSWNCLASLCSIHSESAIVAGRTCRLAQSSAFLTNWDFDNQHALECCGV